MGFFRRKKTAESSNTSTAMNPLAAKLVSNNESTFLSALQEAVSMSDRGDYGGIQAIREAIRIRSGKETVGFYEPHIRSGFMSEELNRYSQAAGNILKLAKQHSLLDDPRVSGDYVAALMTSMSSTELQDLVMKIFKAGGPSAGYEFQLLYNELRSSARWVAR